MNCLLSREVKKGERERKKERKTKKERNILALMVAVMRDELAA